MEEYCELRAKIEEVVMRKSACSITEQNDRLVRAGKSTVGGILTW